MNARFSQHRVRAWARAAAIVVLAAGGIALLRAPIPANAGPSSPAPTPPSPATPPGGDVGARVDLHGPAIDGLFAFTEGAMLENGVRSLYAELRLQGAEGGVSRRAPVALTVVLDHSGSMMGEKIEQARRAVVELIERMHDDDQIGVVIYDHEALVLQSLLPVRAARASLPARVREIQATGGTNIPAGLDLGSQMLASAPAGYVRRLVLISDGQDGSGQSLDAIASRVAARASDRVTTSSIGIGLDYDERFMTTVADSGRGNYAFLRNGSELDPFLRQELEQAASTVADELVAEVTLPAGMMFRSAHGVVATHEGQVVRLPIGTLFAGERRKVVLELGAQAGAAGAIAAARVGVRWRTVADQQSHSTGGAAGVRAVASLDEVNASRDVELHADAISTVIDAQQVAAMNAWREGRRDEALRITQDNLGTLRHVQALAPSPTVAAQIQQLELDDDNIANQSAASESGRSWGLARGARRRAQAEAY